MPRATHSSVTRDSSPADLKTLRGKLSSFRSRTADGWGTGILETDVAGDVAVTGKLPSIQPGDTVEVEGRWKAHPRYGDQFQVLSAVACEPQGAEGRVAWLAERLPNIGPQRARALVDAFGDKLWETIEEQPDWLASVNGITVAMARDIAEVYSRHKGERDAMIRLREWGLTNSQVGRCVDYWGCLDAVIRALSEDPYDLCVHIYGFGFVRADAIARKMGVPREAPTRIRACLDYVLADAQQAGHCYMSGKRLQEAAAQVLGIDKGVVGQHMLDSAGSGRLVRRGWRWYSRHIDMAEATCADRLRAMIGEDDGQ